MRGATGTWAHLPKKRDGFKSYCHFNHKKKQCTHPLTNGLCKRKGSSRCKFRAGKFTLRKFIKIAPLYFQEEDYPFIPFTGAFDEKGFRDRLEKEVGAKRHFVHAYAPYQLPEFKPELKLQGI